MDYFLRQRRRSQKPGYVDLEGHIKNCSFYAKGIKSCILKRIQQLDAVKQRRQLGTGHCHDRAKVQRTWEGWETWLQVSVCIKHIPIPVCYWENRVASTAYEGMTSRMNESFMECLQLGFMSKLCKQLVLPRGPVVWSSGSHMKVICCMLSDNINESSLWYVIW